MLKIRLQRIGRKNIPVYRVVLTDSKNGTRSGKFLEVLGSFDPVHDKKEVNGERIKELIKNGAQLSGTIHNFLIDKKIIEGKKINVLPKKRPIVKEEKKEEGKPAASAPAEAEAKAETAPEKAKGEIEKLGTSPR